MRYPIRWLLVLLILPLTLAAPRADEAELRARGVHFARAYLSPNAYTYRPRGAPDERAASTVAITGHLLLEAYLATREQTFLEAARVAADSVVAHPDMNGDGKTGWGRHWGKSASPSMPGDGTNTSFAMECALPRNRPYDDEFYDNGRIGHFLLDIHAVTATPAYLEAVRKMVDDTFDQGVVSADGKGFVYNKTIGACDRDWHVKNINMLMAVPVGLLAQRTGEARYRARFDALMQAELPEIRFTRNGVPAPNLGYYARQTMRDKPTQGTYVARAQTTDPEAGVSCNLKTGSGESCTEHLGLEARALDVLRRSLPDQPLRPAATDIMTLMSGHEARDEALCAKPQMPSGRPRSLTFCAAYYCALRPLKPDFARLCLERSDLTSGFTPDMVLGLFWGRSDRFPTRAPR